MNLHTDNTTFLPMPGNLSGLEPHEYYVAQFHQSYLADRTPFDAMRNLVRRVFDTPGCFSSYMAQIWGGTDDACMPAEWQ